MKLADLNKWRYTEMLSLDMLSTLNYSLNNFIGATLCKVEIITGQMYAAWKIMI